MKARATALNVVRVLAVLGALALLLVSPVMSETPSGRTYEPVGIAIDAVALIVIIAVVWSVLHRAQMTR